MLKRRFLLSLFLFLPLAHTGLRGQDTSGGVAAAARHIDDRSAFVVERVERDVVQLNRGGNGGLAPGMTLVVKRSGRYFTSSGGEYKTNVIIAVIEVTSVSEASAIGQIRAQNREVRSGEIAWLSPDAAKPARKLPQPAAESSAPAIDPNRPQTPGKDFWTTPSQKPSLGVGAASEMSLAERARLARGDAAVAPQSAAQSDDNAVIPPDNITIVAKSDTKVPAAAPDTTGAPVAAPSSGSSTAPSSARPSPETATSLADSARSARANRTSQNQTPPRPNAATDLQSATPTASAVKPGVPPSAGSSASVSPQPPAETAATDQSPSNSGSANATPSTPATSAVAESARTEANSTPAMPPPAAPVASTKANANRPTSDARVSQPPSADVALAPTKASAPAVATVVNGASPAQPASPATVAMNPSTINAADTQRSGANNAPAAIRDAPSTPAAMRTTFKIKYVAADAVYIEGGKDAGLVEGMTLTVERMSGLEEPSSGPRPNAGDSIAEVAVVSVSNTSAVCEIRNKSIDIQRGDLAVLSQADQDKLAQANTLGPSRKYPQVIAFSEGDPLDEEQREAVPRPPLPEVNRARGRIGVDYTFISSSGASTPTTAQIGGVVRIDMSRIAGSYWNLNGYWRGRLNAFSSAPQTQSVYDLTNRTYTLGFTYVNPGSQWTAGVGRLYLPWATSLDTFDGGYLGRRFGKHTVVGAFAGTDPDPTSFNYNPDLRTAGSFVAFEAGSFDRLRFTSTEGIAVSSIGWSEDRQFLFNETGLFYKRYLSVYNASQADKQHLPSGGIEEGLSRSFTTLRVQPWSRISFDFNHSYFRDVPTFTVALISTGLLDKYLFQGLSAGSRIELPGRISLYGNFGQSNRSGDAHSSLNQLYGITLGRLWFTGIRADVRYSKFASSFGAGNYRAISLSRNLKDSLRLEVTAGRQTFVSSLSVPTDYKLLGSTLDLNLGTHYFIETAFNLQRGLQQSYNQWIVTTGYRFDTKRGRQ